MITRPTVLVLGAGASKPYGFPLGKDLCESIEKFANGVIDKRFADVLQISTEKLIEFGRQFKRSGQYSIDSFLVKIADRSPELFETGTKMVAFAISIYESEKAILTPQNSADDWYRYLWNALSAEIATDWKQVSLNKLKVITFNYDRSLEYSIFLKAKYSWGLSDDQAHEVLKYIPIFHVYGDLGQLTCSSEGAAGEYRQLRNREEVASAASNIRLMHQERQSQVPGQVAEWLHEAKQICFLGFGFDNQNISRIKFAEAMDKRFPWNSKHQTRQNGNPVEVFATTMGLAQRRIEELFPADRNARTLLNIPKPGSIHHCRPDGVLRSLQEWNCLV